MKIAVITGPTASGKSALALERARADRSVEIVNADASCIYRGFDIGTAKPSRAIQEEIPHHLLDICSPSEDFSAADYSVRCRPVIREIISRSKTPIVVGGTGLYIDALFNGLSVIEADPVAMEAAREQYHSEFAELGFDELHLRLKDIDPELYEQIARERNPRRLERAWTHYYATGVALGKARQTAPEPFEFAPDFTVLLPDRDELLARISERTDAMIAAGWLDEVRHLLDEGVTDTMPAMKAIGYKTLAEVVRGSIGIDVARERIIVQTRQYAKRQVTWMKRYV